ncbi:sigma-70 family RNA polymerase sigma factor [Stieleria sp. TO1_6]|uniref:sigma-70 family RNA polymerase sigma factor n=1 Tax=Stieleria tagensis TaxID=2956795 RepID=UPI00209ABFB1|nr:sigma-70 family RNA polymerase sigma factor [Stieleria tagensis]MCO8121986.1 sigma-70 family RNA polymerase sigma factor [Stieleria tagensis]
MSTEKGDISGVLTELAKGDPDAFDRIAPLVYNELHQIAQRLLKDESPAHTLQPTALVNEAYLRMVDLNRIDWQGRTHFFAVGATMMRRILVDHARHRLRLKRGGGMRRISLTDDMKVSARRDEDILAVEEALEKLSGLDDRQAKIVEMRFFAGLTVEQVAEVLGISKRTVESDWTMARAWLRRELSLEETE